MSIVSTNNCNQTALNMWGEEASKRSLLCGLEKNEYFNLIHKSYLCINAKKALGSICLIKRSYRYQKEEVTIYAFHRLVTEKKSGVYSLKLISEICRDRLRTLNVTSANYKAEKIYKAFDFDEIIPTQYHHHYIINPMLLPFMVLGSTLSLARYWIRKALMVNNEYNEKQNAKFDHKLKNHISCRNKPSNNENLNLSLNWECNTLNRYFRSALKASRLLIFTNKINHESILLNIRHNSIWRTFALLDSTYTNSSAVQVINLFKPWILRKCLTMFVPRLTMASHSQYPPM